MKITSIIGLTLFLLISGCTQSALQDPYVVVLGIAQDAGVPQAGCMKECCIGRWNNPSNQLMVTSLGIVDPNSKETWMVEATPDFTNQLKILTDNNQDKLKGIFLTHAHIGHYTGLIHLGREAMGTQKVNVYAMPKMAKFLRSNGPWSQLVDLENIRINKLKNKKTLELNDRISITPFIVPHRDEFSETVGYKIEGPSKSLIFIPDIDKWEKWEKDIEKVASENEYTLIDGSFFENGEIPGRDMSEIPHPFIVESMEVLRDVKDKSGIHFIHFNHTNPVLNQDSSPRKIVLNAGFNIADSGQKMSI